MDSYCSKYDKYHPSQKESHSKKKSRRDDQRKRDSCSPCKIKIITKSNIPGPTGPTGPTGSTGPEGTGHTGPNNTGHTGPQGEIGITLPSTICLNYVTEQNPNGTTIGANPVGMIPPFNTIIKFLYTGPIVERTVTLLLNVVPPDVSDSGFAILSMLEVSCLPFGTPIDFDTGLRQIGERDFGGSGNIILCITMKVNPTISNSVWQLGRIDKLGLSPPPFKSVSLLSLCIN